MLNDYSYRDDPAKADDSRWVHRPRANRESFARRNDPQTVEGKVYMSLRRLIELRKRLDVFAGDQMKVLEPGNDHVFGYLRSNGKDWIAVLANFGDYEQHLADDQLARIGLRALSPTWSPGKPPL